MNDYIGLIEMAEAEWLSLQNDDSWINDNTEHNYWPWFYLLIAAMMGEI